MRKIETLGQFEQLVLEGVRTIPDAYAVPFRNMSRSFTANP